MYYSYRYLQLRTNKGFWAIPSAYNALSFPHLDLPKSHPSAKGLDNFVLSPGFPRSQVGTHLSQPCAPTSFCICLSIPDCFVFKVLAHMSLSATNCKGLESRDPFSSLFHLCIWHDAWPGAKWNWWCGHIPRTDVFIFFKHLYWSIIALKWCVSFCFITK